MKKKKKVKKKKLVNKEFANLPNNTSPLSEITTNPLKESKTNRMRHGAY
jgi:hypothetical protein